MKILMKVMLIVLAVSMCLCAFVSCAKEKTGPADAAVGDQTDAGLAGNTGSDVQSAAFDTPESYVIKKSGSSLNVVLTRPSSTQSNSPILTQQQELSKLLAGLLGVSPSTSTDVATTEDSQKFEIIIGPTDHPETQSLLEECSYGEYLVRGVGNKIIVLGYTGDTVNAAINHLNMLIAKGFDEESGTITINTNELSFKGDAVNQRLDALPIYNGGTFLTHYDAGYADVGRQCDEIIINSTSKTQFNAYIEKLKTNGYSVYNTNDVTATGSKFVTLSNSQYTVNAGYYAYESRTRIAVEPLAPGYQMDTSWTRLQASAVYMLGVVPTSSTLGAERNNGLSMVIKLEDGRFIVIDGGENALSLYSAGESTSEAESDYSNVNHLLDLLNTFNTGHEKPTVAAWILTHDHGDHADLLQHDYKYLSDDHPNLKYSGGSKTGTKGIVVQNIYMAAYSKFETDKSGLSSERYQDIMTKVAPHFGATVHRVHPGWKLQVANCTVEFMYTIEAWADGVNIVNNLGLNDSTSLGGYNHSSLVFKTTLKDSSNNKTLSVMNTGDASSTGISIASKLFGDAAVKTDVMVISHHGFGSGYDTLMTQMVNKIAARIVLVPRNGVPTRSSTQTAVNNATYAYHAGTAGNTGHSVSPGTNYGNTVTVTMDKTVTSGPSAK